MAHGDPQIEAALAHHRAGRLGEARECYEAALRAAPDSRPALNNLAAILVAQGQSPRACDLLQRLAALEPDDASAQGNLGYALLRAGRSREAIVTLREALARAPERAELHNAAGLALAAEGELEAAEAALRRAVALAPIDPHPMNNLCDVLVRAGKLDAAIAFLRAGGAQAGASEHAADRRYKLGYALMLNGDLAAASAAFEEVARASPGYAPTYLNLGTIAYWLHDAPRAEAMLRRALELAPGYVEAQENLGHLFLATGRAAEGWRLCEARTCLDAPARVAVDVGLAPWDGRSDPALTLVVSPEQGLGDVMQHARFLAAARRRVGRLVLVIDGYWQPLRTLLGRVEGVDAVVDHAGARERVDAISDPAGAREGVDAVSDSAGPREDLDAIADPAGARACVACPIASLPHLLAVGDAVQHPPYLSPSEASAARWRARLGPPDALRVGVCWAGSAVLGAEHGRVTDRRRSLPADALSRLLAIDDVDFHGLDPRVSSAGATGEAGRVRDWSHALHDMDETAGLVAELDLVITVDTAVAHLAGGMGKPVWMLNRFDTDWRWGFDGERSPWYPTMRIIRQRTLGDWGPVIADVATRLEREARSWRRAAAG